MKPWTHTYETMTSLSPDALWPVLADVRRWPAIDDQIETLELSEAPAEGVRFHLRPRGGPRLRFEITAFDPPRRYADTCSLLGATMTTAHELVREGEATTIRVRIEITGLLSFLWGRTVGRTHAEGLPAQTERFVAAARQA